MAQPVTNTSFFSKIYNQFTPNNLVKNLCRCSVSGTIVGAINGLYHDFDLKDRDVCRKGFFNDPSIKTINSIKQVEIKNFAFASPLALMLITIASEMIFKKGKYGNIITKIFHNLIDRIRDLFFTKAQLRNTLTITITCLCTYLLLLPKILPLISNSIVAVGLPLDRLMFSRYT